MAKTGPIKTGPAKAETLKPRLPRGLLDRREGDILAQNRMLEVIGQTFALYGFEALETPFIEYTEALGKFLPDLDRPNEGVFSFQDDDESWLSLRYDLTAPLARFVAENFDVLPKPYRSFRAGYVFRNEKPGPGRFRQFMQCDADIVGAASVAADAEICMMAADTLDKLALAGQYVVKINNRKVLDGVMETIGLGGENEADRRLTVLRAIDKLDRLGVEGVRQLLGEGRKDESGDVTKGAGLEEAAIRLVLSYVTAEPFETIAQGSSVSPEGSYPTFDTMHKTQRRLNNIETIDFLLGQFGSNEKAETGLEELRQIALLVKGAGYSDEQIRIDPSVVRGLEYYTGPVYEAELTFPVTNEEGQIVRFGSVAGGGRYDGLVGRFRGESVPATGFSIGVSRLFSALKLVGGGLVATSGIPGPVVVLVLDRENIADYQRLAATLRQAGISSEAYLGSAGMKAQMKYADRRSAPLVVIQGSNERDTGEVQIKDLIEGAKAAQAITSNIEWKAARPAQFSVPESGMVERVKELLAGHFPEAAV